LYFCSLKINILNVMDYSGAKLQKNNIQEEFLALIPKSKRGFKSNFNMWSIFKCIHHKVDTGCPWCKIFIDIEELNPPFSWQIVYYYYQKWCEVGIFSQLYNLFLKANKDILDLSNLNLDGTHTATKKAVESSGYQKRKSARTSNILVMTDAQGILLSIGDVQAGNHHDLFNILPQFSKMVNDIKQLGIETKGIHLNADKGFDSKRFRRAIQRRGILPNIPKKEYKREGRKVGRKRYFNDKIYKQRVVIEHFFAWVDSHRTMQTRYEKYDDNWIQLHYLTALFRLLKKFG